MGGRKGRPYNYDMHTGESALAIPDKNRDKIRVNPFPVFRIGTPAAKFLPEGLKFHFE
jgi:hypothetical protein